MHYTSVKIGRISLACLLFLFLFSACGDDSNDTFPYVYVNATLDMQNPLYIDLLDIGGSAIVTNEGLYRNGIIVYRSGIDEFKAYDRTCPYELSDSCAITPSETSIVNAICPCCKSEYELMYGSVSKGPAFRSLKEYSTTFNGVFININN